jgi:hypothetical protein
LSLTQRLGRVGRFEIGSHDCNTKKIRQGGLEVELIFIFTLKTWSCGPGQSYPALPEETLQEFEVN